MVDVVVDGVPTPIAVETTKQGNVYTFNRVTGEPVWPIEERPVAASEIPGERLSVTQPFPTRPLQFEIQDLNEDTIIHAGAARGGAGNPQELRTGPLFNPPIQVGHPSGPRSFVSCPAGASNIYYLRSHHGRP